MHRQSIIFVEGIRRRSLANSVLTRQHGRVRWMHVGEGAYDETEEVIKKLLAEEKGQSKTRVDQAQRTNDQ